MAEPHPGREALAHIRRALEQEPIKDDQELSAALQCLARFRKELIQAQSEDPTQKDRDRLSNLNAIIAVTMGISFPLGDPPWAEFAKCEAWLEDLVGKHEDASHHNFGSGLPPSS